VLIKPQYEAGPDHVKKGLVRDPAIHAQVCSDVAALLTSLGWNVLGLIPSPITGGDGNHEFLIAAKRG
jgi:23S rRNA (cytidine1920-2'-O)/16S rRNA (cytidine1409-2'-O)-methyltransferase